MIWLATKVSPDPGEVAGVRKPAGSECGAGEGREAAAGLLTGGGGLGRQDA